MVWPIVIAPEVSAVTVSVVPVIEPVNALPTCPTGADGVLYPILHARKDDLGAIKHHHVFVRPLGAHIIQHIECVLCGLGRRGFSRF
jgi:hypothetical protein